MTTVTEHIRQHLLESRGFFEQEAIPDLAELRRSEWDPRFERLMRNRLVVGTFRYGSLWNDKMPWRRIVRSIHRRIEQFAESGNRENLVDVANLAMVLWVNDDHPFGHFKSVDDGEHT